LIHFYKRFHTKLTQNASLIPKMDRTFISPIKSMISTNNFYLFVDKESSKEKGFGLLTRAKVEGERYELREVSLEQVNDLLQQISIKIQQREFPTKQKKLDDAIPVPSNVDELLNEDACDEEETDKAVLKTKEVAKEVAVEIISEQSDSLKDNVSVKDISLDDMSPMEMMTAEMTRGELLEELLYKFDKRKKKRLDNRIKKSRRNGVKNKRPPLILPPGWDELEAREMVDEIKKFNKINEDSKDERLESILNNNLKSKVSRPGKCPIKTSCSDPIKLPADWEERSPAELAAYLRTKRDMCGKPLTDLCETLEKESSWSGLLSSSNTVESSKQSKKRKPLPNTQDCKRPKLEEVVKRVKAKAANNSARSLPIVLPSDWQSQQGKGQLRGDQSGVPVQEVNHDMNNNGEILDEKNKTVVNCPVEQPSRVMLPSNWKEMNSAGALKDKIREVNPGKDLSVVFEKMKMQEKKFKRIVEPETSPIMLPEDWRLFRESGDLYAKIKAVNPDKDVTYLEGKLRTEEKKLPEPCREVDEGRSLSSHVMLPENWKELRNSGTLLEKMQDVNPDIDVSSVVKRLRVNEKKQGSTVHLRTAPNRVMLPANWKELENSGVLIDKIREVNSDKDVSSVIKELRFYEKEQNVTPHVQTADDRVILPANWKEIDNTSALLDQIREVNPHKDVSYLKGKLGTGGMNRPESSRGVVRGNHVMLPDNWEELRNSGTLIDKIKEVNPDQDVSSVIEKLNKKQKSTIQARSVDRRVILPANWKELENSGDLLDRIREVNSDKEMSAVIEQLRSKAIAEKELARKMKAKVTKSKSSRKYTELVARLERKKDTFQKNSKPANQLSSSAGIQLPQDWETLGMSDSLAEKLKAQNPDMEIPSELLNNLTKGKIGKLEVKRNKNSHSVQLPVNWWTSSGSWEEKFERLDLDPERRSKLLANLKKSEYEYAKRTRYCRPNKVKRVRRSLRKRRPEPKRSGIKLPPNWKQLTKKDLAESISKEGLGPEDRHRLVANLERQERSLGQGSCESKFRERGSKKKLKKSSSKALGSFKKEIHQKKTRHVQRKEKKVKKKFKPTFSIIASPSEEEKVKLLKPHELGWRRECRVGVTGARLTPEGNFINEKLRVDIYYWPPSPFSRLEELPQNCKNKELRSYGARRMKNVKEMEEYLADGKNKSAKLTLENFSFKKKILNLGKFEYVWKTDEAEKNLLSRKQEKAITAEEIKVAEAENETDCKSDRFVGNQQDLFGDIADLDDEDNLTKDSSHQGQVAGVDKHLPSGAAVENTNIHVELNQEHSSHGEENVDPENSNTCKKVQSKKENRKKLTICNSKVSLNVSVKQDRPVKKALSMFCSQYLLKMSSLQFWCGKTRLSGEEKVKNLEEMIIRVTLEENDWDENL